MTTNWDITFSINPYQHALLERLKDHIDINYVVATEMVKSKKGEKETEQSCTEELSGFVGIGFVRIGFVGIGFVGIVAGPATIPLFF